VPSKCRGLCSSSHRRTSGILKSLRSTCISTAALSLPACRSGSKLNGIARSPFSTSEKLTPFNDVTHYNNYYEFGASKEQPAEMAKTLKTSPWTVSVEGAVGKPRVFDIDGSRPPWAGFEGSEASAGRCSTGWYT